MSSIGNCSYFTYFCVGAEILSCHRDGNKERRRLDVRMYEGRCQKSLPTLSRSSTSDPTLFGSELATPFQLERRRMPTFGHQTSVAEMLLSMREDQGWELYPTRRENIPFADCIYG